MGWPLTIIKKLPDLSLTVPDKILNLSSTNCKI